MPAIANIVIKKNDGTTDITWSAVQPSSGDGTPATWKSTSVGSAQAHQPEFRLSARDAQKGNVRTVRATIRYPQIATNSTTGVTSVIGVALLSATLEFPKTMSNTDVNEAVAQTFNLLDSTLIADCFKAGYSAT